MTLLPSGGPAIPVSVDTTRTVQGGAAIPVYGYTTAPTDGRPALAGPALPVRVLTAADLKENGGQWTVEGRPYALPVYTAPASVKVAGGAAIAVYPVNAWPPTTTAAVTSFSDSFARANGAIGNGWTGATWTIASNAAINTPVPGGEQLSDPGLEATYTAGLCNSWDTMSGSPTVAEDNVNVHGGTKAQAFTSAAYNNSLRMLRSPNVWALGTWVRGGAWAIRLSGATNGDGVELRSTNWTHTRVPITFAAYTQCIVHARCTTANSMSFYVPLKSDAGAGSPIVVDDLSLKILTLSELIATYPTSTNSVYTASVNITIPSLLTTGIETLGGLALNVDSTSNPQNFILAHIDGKPGASECCVRLEKCIAGVYTTLVDVASRTYAAGGTLQVKRNGTTFQLFYRGTQVGTDQTVSDTLTGTNHGLFALHPNASFQNFSIVPTV